MIKLEDALQAYVTQASPLPVVELQVAQAWGHILAEELSAKIDLPRFDQSAMDGYALRAEDTGNGLLRLPVTGESAAGHKPTTALEAGAAWRIFTGAAIPKGADTVIPQEHVTRSEDHIELQAAYAPGRNIRYQGEELRAGAQIARLGDRLTPGLIASIANAGYQHISVHRHPRISVLISGDEVRSPQSLKNRPLGETEIPDSNGAYLGSWLMAHGYQEFSMTHVADTEADVLEAIREAADCADLIITTGGASVGDRDFIPQAAQDCGFEQVFWRVAQKPGKPLFFGQREDCLLLGLPGNPGAVLVGMELHARTLLNCLAGQRAALPEWQHGQLTADVAADPKRDRLLRMLHSTDSAGRNRLQPLGQQDSHMLSNLADATVLVHLPSRSEAYASGEVLKYIDLTR